MKVKGIEGMTVAEIQDEVANGGKFVQYTCCISVIVVTFRQPSAIYFIKRNQSAFVKGLPFTIISFLFGWWGIPWGIIYTLGCLYTNAGGGKNVTDEQMRTLHRQTHGHVFEFESAVAFAHNIS